MTLTADTIFIPAGTAAAGPVTVTPPLSRRRHATTGPRLRQVPVPVCEPPFDDEREDHGFVDHEPVALPLPVPAAVRSSRLPGGAPDSAAFLRPPGGAGAAAWRPATLTGGDGLPDPRQPAAVLVRGLLECLAGTRSPGQLQRWTTPAVHAELVDLAGTGRSVTGHGRVHVSMPRPGVAEVVTVVRRGRRATALALRLEGFHGRWRATVVHFG